MRARLHLGNSVLVFLCCCYHLLLPLRGICGSETDDKTPQSLLRALQGLQFDTQQSLVTKDLNLRFGTGFVTFDRGRILFLKPVAGVVTGLYFWGEGTIVVGPPDPIEKQQLNLFTGAPTLNERFQEAFVRFTDDTYSLLMEQINAAGDSEPHPIDIPPERFQVLLRNADMTNFRVLADLLNGRTLPFFTARLRGHKLGMFDFSYDHRRKENLSLGQFHESSGQVVYDTWCSYSAEPGKGAFSSVGKGRERIEAPQGDLASEVHFRLIDSLAYDVDTRIDKADKLTGLAKVEFRSGAEGEWVVNFELSRYLKVTQVLDEKQRPVLFYQNSEMTTDEEVTRLGQDAIFVLLNEPLHQGETRRLQFEYSGDVISRAGKGVFYVGARGSWYPNTGVSDRAKYRLSFQFPKAYTIVATGDLLREWEEGENKHSQWVTEGEVPVAGFNYGDYVKRSATAGAIPVDVYANRGIENVYMEVMARLEVLRELSRQRAMGLHRSVNANPELAQFIPDFTDFDTSRFSSEIASRVAKTLVYYESLLTPYPYRKLAVSQIPGRFSQGWPSLLYVSSLAFLTREQRARLGMEMDRESLLLECLPAHELAHQWLGNLVGWKTYHDVWMTEGFSNYLGYLSLKLRYPSDKQLHELLRQAKERMLARNSDGQTIENAGPIWLASRLSSSKFPNGFNVLVYEKGAWVLHMLRCLLTDSNTNDDSKFIALIWDFLTTYRDKMVSTDDFKKTAEKYMSKELDLEGNRRLDWFFDQWVFGTGIPTYRISYSTSSLKNGTYLLKGKITQENVPELFMMPVDVFAHFAPQKIQRIGRLEVSGNQTPFKFILKSRPTKVTLDEKNAILCDNKTL